MLLFTATGRLEEGVGWPIVPTELALPVRSIVMPSRRRELAYPFPSRSEDPYAPAPVPMMSRVIGPNAPNGGLLVVGGALNGPFGMYMDPFGTDTGVGCWRTPRGFLE